MEVECHIVEKINDCWYKKLILDESGRPVYSYHYLVENAESSVQLIWVTPIARECNSYLSIEKDLRDILVMLDEYEQISQLIDLPTSSQEKNEKNRVLLKCFMAGIVITYMRCFAEANGRRTLKEDIIKNKENREFHRYISKMRNEYIAHADNSMHENYRIVIPVPSLDEIRNSPNNKAHTLPISEIVQLSFERFVDDFRSLQKEVFAYVSKRHLIAQGRLNSEFESITPEFIMDLLYRNTGKQIITYAGK